jgi:hypothetical protein
LSQKGSDEKALIASLLPAAGEYRETRNFFIVEIFSRKEMRVYLLRNPGRLTPIERIFCYG